MGCWVKQYKKGVAWFCNTTDKRVSPIMEYKEALLANIHAKKCVYMGNYSDARLVTDWPAARKEAKRIIKTCSEEEINNEIELYYEAKLEKLGPWLD
tara:strand:+ start:906 stop:1196 length:291 start_codon:yes stop_codon:yes gene_type:complete